MFINKVRIALQNFTVVTLIKPPAHPRLLVNNGIRMIQDVSKGGTKKSGVVAVKRVLVKFNNAANGMAEGFGRDGAPMGATAANVMVALYHRYSGPVSPVP